MSLRKVIELPHTENTLGLVLGYFLQHPVNYLRCSNILELEGLMP